MNVHPVLELLAAIAQLVITPLTLVLIHLAMRPTNLEFVLEIKPPNGELLQWWTSCKFRLFCHQESMF